MKFHLKPYSKFYLVATFSPFVSAVKCPSLGQSTLALTHLLRRFEGNGVGNKRQNIFNCFSVSEEHFKLKQLNTGPLRFADVVYSLGYVENKVGGWFDGDTSCCLKDKTIPVN